MKITEPDFFAAHHILLLHDLFTHFERRFPEMEERFNSSTSRYAGHLRRVETITTAREWSALPRYEIEPFFFELGDCRRGRLMRKKPERIAGRHEYAISVNGELIAERQHVQFPGQHYERFLVADGRDVWSDLYSYEPDKPPINATRLVHESSKFMCLQTWARYGRSQHVYEFDGGRISAFISMHHRSGPRPIIRAEYVVDYVNEASIRIWETSTGHRRLAYEGVMIANSAVQPTATGKPIASAHIQ